MKPTAQTSPPWSSIAPYLDRALDLEPRARENWLAEVTATQPEIGRILRGMLARHVLLDAQGFLEQSAIDSPATTAQAGMRVGAYTLDKLIGRGGMGEVWLATRSDGRYQGRCAIKFLSTESRGQQAERFAREGQLLGRLTHPNIARLLDAGATEDGRSYLALEYVEGIPIDRYCEQRSLDLAARLRLFLEVLSAVTHAQDHLVVHRDIKPSNVLVTNEGVVKLLDFGVAKLLEGTGLSGYGMLTRESAAALTPAYAAPEQLTNGSITTATDVYALGVLLYVLLSGRHPTATATHSPADMVNGILNVVPQPLSVNTKSVDSDLETIVAKALKKSPSERYSSANAFADDVRRYLSHQPITARPDSALYRFRKFVRRNRAPVAAGVLLVMGLAVALFSVNRERVIAERRFDQLRTLSDKVFELDQGLSQVTGSSLARQRIVIASLQYLQALEKEAHGDIELAMTIANGYWRVARIQGVPVESNLGEYEKAEQSLANSARNIEIVLAARPNDTRAWLLYGVVAHDRMIVAGQNKHENEIVPYAEKSWQWLVRFLEKGNGTDQQKNEAIAWLGNIGLAYVNNERYEKAISTLNGTVAIENRLQLPKSAHRLNAIQSVLANAQRLQGDVVGALETIRKVREEAVKLDYNSEHVHMAQLYGVYLREGMIVRDAVESGVAPSLDPAVPFRRSFEITETMSKLDPKDSASRDRLTTASRELGFVLRDRDPAEALKVYDTALKHLEETPTSSKKTRTRAELLAYSAYPLRKLHRLEEAKRRVNGATESLRDLKDLPADKIELEGPQYAALTAVADLHAEEGNLADAIAGYREILSKSKFRNEAAGPENNLRSARRTAVLYRTLADLYARNGDRPQSDKMNQLRRSLAEHWERRLPGNPIVRTLAE